MHVLQVANLVIDPYKNLGGPCLILKFETEKCALRSNPNIFDIKHVKYSAISYMSVGKF